MHAKKDWKFSHICLETYHVIRLNDPKGLGFIYNAKATKTVGYYVLRFRLHT